MPRLVLALLAGAWIGLLLLPLNLRVTKVGRDQALFEPHLDRSVWIGLGVAAFVIASQALQRLRGGARAGHPGRGGHLDRIGGQLRALAEDRPWLPRAAGYGLVALAFLLPLTGNPYHVAVATQTALYVCLALGLNIVVGQAGLLVLGYAAFYAAGAYTYAILNRAFGLPFWAGLPAGAAVAMAFGLLLGAPTLRLRGDYLAIVTLGFGEMMRIILITADGLTGGPNGISGIAGPALGGLRASDRELYWLTLALVVLTATVSDRLNCSRLGRAWIAMREDETAARAMGISVSGMRLLAFSLSALWAGLCGVFFAAKQSFISPESFTFNESVTVLAMVILGGMGSIPGVIAGALLLGLLPEVLRGASEYRMITLAGLMVLMMIYRPQGLFPSQRRRLELSEP